MITMRNIKFLALGFLVVILVSGCSMPISKNLRDEAADITIGAVAADPQKYQGNTVIWGGRIIRTLNLKTGTEVYILAMPLDYEERPEEDLTTIGRFIAKTPDYLDSELYRRGREVTVAGAVTGVETHPIGEVEYAYPVVDIKELHLFSPEVTYLYPDYYYWGPWGPYWYDGPFFEDRFHGEFWEHGHEGFHEHGEESYRGYEGEGVRGPEGGFRGPEGGGFRGPMGGGGMEHGDGRR